jgi:hypothetical protein
MPRWYLPSPQDLSDASLEELAFFDDRAHWVATEGAYGAVHSTKPQSLAYGLNDSPAGLAAWILEKFNTWSDCGGDIESVFSRDDLLTNVSILLAHPNDRLVDQAISRAQPEAAGPAGNQTRRPVRFCGFP